MVEVSEKDGAAIFRVRVQPRASRTEVAGEHAGAIKLRIAAPPVDGKANDECVRFLARLLEVPPRTIEIISGDSSRDKIIRVQNTNADRVRSALMKSPGGTIDISRR
ncbi:MAG TPA: DUF167 domain-containing protein [Blastocatellia bacterium]|nr:DUF167 domain-containing protein [Blastocatellia bacterium]